MSRTLSATQLHALSFIATRAEYGKLSRTIESVARKAGADVKLPRASVTLQQDSSLDQDGGHSATVSRSATRLFALVYSVTALYELVIGLLRRRRLSALLRSLSSLSALRLASAISLYSTIYRLLLPALRSLLPSLAISSPSRGSMSLRKAQGRLLGSRVLPPFLAGVVASPAMILEGKGQRRVTISLYALTRAIHGLLGVAGAKGLLTKSLRDGSWWWGGHILFAAANALLLHAFVYDPSTFPAAYSSFILRYSSAYLPSPPHCSLSATWPARREIVDALAACTQLRYPAFVSPLLFPNSSSKGFELPAGVSEGARQALEKIRPILDISAHPGHGRLTCAMLHPEERSCWNVFASFVVGEFRGASKFFGALALLGTLTRWKKFLQAPSTGLTRALSSTVLSSAMVSLSLGTAWSSICLFQQYLPRTFLPTKRWLLQGFLAGLWVRLVGKARSTDLGMYAARMAVQTGWEVAVQRGRVKNVRNGEIVYLGLSMGVLLAIHETDPTVIQSRLVRSALARVGGPSTAEAEEKTADELKRCS